MSDSNSFDNGRKTARGAEAIPQMPIGFGTARLPTHDPNGEPYPKVLPEQMPIEIVTARLWNVSGCRPQWRAFCPSHANSHPLLRITETADGILTVLCFAGCKPEMVMEGIGLDLAFLYPGAYARACGRGVADLSRQMAYGRSDDHIYKLQIDSDKLTAILRGFNQTYDALQPLADHLRLPAISLGAIGCRYCRDSDAYAFPECNDDRQLCGIAWRNLAGNRWSVRGGRRGLIVPRDFKLFNGAVYLPVGASDVAALHAIKVAAIGRPVPKMSAFASEWLVDLLRQYPGRQFIVLGERDESKDDKGVGFEAAQDLAIALTTELGRPVTWALPAQGFKDVRDQIVAGAWHRGLDHQEAAQ